MPADVGLWGALACVLGRHMRSKGAARSTPEGWTSKCARCGVPMVRAHGGGKWMIVKAPLVQEADIKGEVAPTEALVHAISRSRQTGKRREERARLKAQQAEAKAAKLQQKAAAAARPRKGLLRRRVEPATGFAAIATAAQHIEAKPKKSLFRRKGKAAADEIEFDASGTSETMADTPKRGLLRRKPKPAIANGGGEDVAPAAAATKPKSRLLGGKAKPGAAMEAPSGDAVSEA